MSKQTITPGPWEAIYDAPTWSWEINQGHKSGTSAGIRVWQGANHSIDEQAANAQAIAAVPDMIEALRMVIDGHDCRENGEDMTKECPTRVAVIAALRKAGQID